MRDGCVGRFVVAKGSEAACRPRSGRRIDDFAGGAVFLSVEPAEPGDRAVDDRHDRAEDPLKDAAEDDEGGDAA